MTTLTEAQAAVLTPALARADGCIFPVTAALKGGAVGNVAKSLLKHNMIEEVPATDDAVVWRCNDAGQPLTLRITAAGARRVRGAVVQANELPQASVETPLVMLDGRVIWAGKKL